MKQPSYRTVRMIPFRCSRGHFMLVTRSKETARPGNCDHIECQDNNDIPVQCGPAQSVTVELYKVPVREK
jgi:hypothetical protein